MSWREILGVADTASNSNTHDMHKPTVHTSPADDTHVTENQESIATLSLDEENRIRTWLAHIEETDPIIIDEYLSKCRNNLKHRRYFLMRSKEVSESGSNP